MPESTTAMPDPVATVEGCVYERSQIEEWIRRKRQQRAAVTPFGTGLEHALLNRTQAQQTVPLADCPVTMPFC